VGALTISPSIYQGPDADVAKSFVPVALVAVSPQILAVTPSLPVTSLAEFIAYAKASPGKVNFGSAGVGSQPHVLGELLKLVVDIKLTHIPYRGSAPAITDLLGGQIDLLWDQVTNAITQVQSGALHGIAVTSPQRLEQLKDVPTTAELGMPEVSYTMWHGLYVAKGTPKDIVDALNGALRKAVSEPGVVAKLKDLGTVPFPEAEMSPAAHAKLFASDLPRVAKLVESSGIKQSEAK
jgi:tripartite-type tricarboxylate transporter receptor subunit TctC